MRGSGLSRRVATLPGAVGLRQLLLSRSGPRGTAAGVVNSHLDTAQRERLAALESSDQDEVTVVGNGAKRRGGKVKPVRHQLRRTPTLTQQAGWEAVQQARAQGFSLRAISRNLGMAKNTAKTHAVADAPPTKKLSDKERAKIEALAAPLTVAD